MQPKTESETYEMVEKAKRTPYEYLMDRLSHPIAKDQCLEWSMGAKTGGNGMRYGVVRSPTTKKQVDVCKIAAALTLGPRKDGEVIIHDCGNSLCYNPAPGHMRYGSPSERSLSRWENDTMPQGEKHYRTTLKAWQVRQVRRAKSHRAGAEKVGCPYETSRAIRNGVRWLGLKWTPGELAACGFKPHTPIETQIAAKKAKAAKKKAAKQKETDK